MKNSATLFLKLVVILMGIAILALCIFLVPKFGNFAGDRYCLYEISRFPRDVQSSCAFLLCSRSGFPPFTVH